MQNQTMMQYFHWYLPDDGLLWKQVKKEAKKLSQMGITSLWLPPATKASAGGMSVGYDVYDLFDLGEFDQKNSIRTKYGTKEEYLQAIKAAHDNNIAVYADTVLNHKAGADELERFNVRKVDSDDRTKVISEVFEIDAWTKFTFPGRKGKYSDFVWDFMCFSGVDWAHDIGENGIFSIQNGQETDWEEVVGDEKGNYDYLMYADIEYRNKAVRDEIKYWGDWYIKETGVDGFRLDAVKHITPAFFNEWIDYLQKDRETPLFFVGEYWNIHSAVDIKKYIDATGGRMQLFDAPMVHNFNEASNVGNQFDMRNILNNTLVQEFPTLAITLVGNHDAQPLQALESPVADWFKPLAYAVILLREGGIPCIFYPHLYGAKYTDKGSDGGEYEITIPPMKELSTLTALRSTHAYGSQHDYFDHGNCIGWTRKGDEKHKNAGLAVIMSNGASGFKNMEIGKQHAGKTFVDALGNEKQKIIINDDGTAEFHCGAGSVSIWITEIKNSRLNQ